MVISKFVGHYSLVLIFSLNKFLNTFSEQYCGNIFKEIVNLGLDSKGFIWISNQQSITGTSLKNAPNGKICIYL